MKHHWPSIIVCFLCVVCTASALTEEAGGKSPKLLASGAAKLLMKSGDVKIAKVIAS